MDRMLGRQAYGAALLDTYDDVLKRKSLATRQSRAAAVGALG